MLVGMQKDLHGLPIGGIDGDLGKIEEFYFDAATFVIRHVVVETGTWMDEHKVRLPPESLRDIDWDRRRIETTWTKSEGEMSPRVHTDRPLVRQREIDQTATGDDPNLRSSTAVIGCHLVAVNGDIGHVEDCLVDPSTWIIHYLVVDVRKLWPGRQVLISPAWIARLDWDESRVYVDMTSEQIETSPEYDPTALVRRAYETRLYAYYGREGYWSRRRAESIRTGSRAASPQPSPTRFP